MRAVILLAFAGSVVCAQTTVRFSTDPVAGAFALGPFPSNALAVADSTQLTGLRIDLPDSEKSCSGGSGPVCSNNASLNQLDGFSVNPRLMLCFSGDVRLSTLSEAVSIIPVRGPENRSHEDSGVAINQIVLDPATNCAFAKPGQVLDQQTEYLLAVTNALRDGNGAPVTADPAYSDCVNNQTASYCQQLSAALRHAHLNQRGRVVSASLFTTMTVTSWLEHARQFVDSQPSVVLPAGVPWIFPLSQVQKITWFPDQAPVPSEDIALAALTNVDSIAFGLLLSPNYLSPLPPNPGTIGSGPADPNAYVPVSFHVFLPRTSSDDSEHKKHEKIPVIIYGHGLGDNQFGAPTFIASTFAQNGFATLAMEVTGYGFGSGGKTIVTAQNTPFTVSTPGRGLTITGPYATDGCIAPGAFGIRDCARQTAVDLFALIHAIQETNGLGLNLDPERIYYVGQSLGSIVGTLFMAVEPAVRTAVLNGAGGTQVDIARLAVTGRPLGLEYLVSVDPSYSLLNVAARKAPLEPYFHDAFNDNYVLRSSQRPRTPPSPLAVSPVTNTVPGAMADQAAFEAADWIDMVGDALAFAPHLIASPLAGVPAKNILFQFGLGDLEVPNPTESAVVRAAKGRSSTSVFQFPWAVSQQPGLALVTDPAFGKLPILPHRVLSNPTILTPGYEAEKSVALAEQQQAADYFSSDGSRVSNANRYLIAPFSPDSNLFVNRPESLPEELNFVQFAP